MVREALTKVEGGVRDFLIRSAVLDEFSASLCEEVLGVTGAARTLRGLERDNLFVVPLDRQRRWYRYYSLFRDMLLGELANDDAELIPVLRRRAAAWHQANGTPERAVDYLLRNGDVDELGPLLTSVMRPAYLQGRISTIDRWLSSVSPPLPSGIHHSPSWPAGWPR